MITTADSLLVTQYCPPAGAYDELCTGAGQVRAHWQYLTQALGALGPVELERRSEEVRRLLREYGVTYHVYGDPQGKERPWDLDPIPLLISSQEWAGIESGLVQRAEVLNLVLKDIYGPRELIKKGLIPLELIYAHRGFLRPCTGIRSNRAYELTLYAADLARGSDGRVCVLSDRTQAPSGLGYALANRVVISRILPSLFRDAQVHRLALFFHSLRMTLVALSPEREEEPHIVVLSPGPLNETYFEQGYLASYLGYPLVQGGDLSVVNGRVWLRSLQGLEPVDVILRRVDDHYCDPVELLPDSRLGVPGLVEATRRGAVAVVNPLGSSVLENPGLDAYLEAIAHYLLGQALELPSVPTWWCGNPEGQSHVLANLDKLVIKPIYRGFGTRPVFGPLLSAKERMIWSERIRLHPHAYVGQELIHLSSTPALLDSRIVACQTLLRSFLVARADGYVVMPGGLTRIAPDRGPCIISNQTGAISKDTWVLASEPEKQVSLRIPQARPAALNPHRILASGAANNLFWLGRYTERAEQNLRLLRTVLDIGNNALEFGEGHQRACTGELLRILARLTNIPVSANDDPEGVPAVLAAIFDPDRFGTVVYDLHTAMQAAYAVRDRLDHDAWRVIHTIRRHLQRLAELRRGPVGDLQDALDEVITTLAAFSGLMTETMIRGQSWLFLDMGRRLERAMALIAILRATVLVQHSASMDVPLLEAVLRATASLITYRRRYHAVPELQAVFKLLITDVSHPRALAYQLVRLQAHVESLPKGSQGHLGTEKQLLREAANALSLAHTGALNHFEDGKALRQALDPVLARIGQGLSQCSDTITQSYFADVHGLQQLLTHEAGS